MPTRVFCLFILGLAMIATAVAQTPTPSTEEVPFTNLADALFGVNVPLLTANCLPPVVGLHCVYYAGDFNPKPAKFPNAVFNQIFNDGGNIKDGQVWVPIPIKKKIVVQGVILNELFTSPPPATTIGHWQIRQGIAAGDGGTVICGGTETATLNGTTGRSFTVGGTTYTEYNYQILISDPNNYCTLTVPPANAEPQDLIVPPGPHGQCPPNCFVSGLTDGSSAADAPQANSFAYLSAVPQPAAHHRGLASIYDKSFFNSSFYHKTFVNTENECSAPAPGPPPDAITVTPPPPPPNTGCRLFSIGIIGTGH